MRNVSANTGTHSTGQRNAAHAAPTSPHSCTHFHVHFPFFFWLLFEQLLLLFSHSLSQVRLPFFLLILPTLHHLYSFRFPSPLQLIAFHVHLLNHNQTYYPLINMRTLPRKHTHPHSTANPSTPRKSLSPWLQNLPPSAWSEQQPLPPPPIYSTLPSPTHHLPPAAHRHRYIHTKITKKRFCPATDPRIHHITATLIVNAKARGRISRVVPGSLDGRRIMLLQPALLIFVSLCPSPTLSLLFRL